MPLYFFLSLSLHDFPSVMYHWLFSFFLPVLSSLNVCFSPFPAVLGHYLTNFDLLYLPLLLSSSFLPSSIFQQLLHRCLYCCFECCPLPPFPIPFFADDVYSACSSCFKSLHNEYAFMFTAPRAWFIFNILTETATLIEVLACITLVVSTWMNTCKPQPRLHWRDTCCDWLNTTRCCSHPFYAHSLSLGCWSVLYW